MTPNTTPKDAVDESDLKAAAKYATVEVGEDEDTRIAHDILTEDAFLAGASHGRRSRDDEVKELRELVEVATIHIGAFKPAGEDEEGELTLWLEDAEKVMGK